MWLTAGLCLSLLSPLGAQQSSRVTLEPNPTLFSVLAVMNACGYNHELAASDPVRAAIRKDVAQGVAESEAAAAAHREMCQFYRDHQQVDQVRDLAQYVSLALSLGGPPKFAPIVKESDLPPDASYVLVVPARNGTTMLTALSLYRDALAALAESEMQVELFNLHDLLSTYAVMNVSDLDIWDDTAHFNADGGRLFFNEVHKRLVQA